MARWTSRLFVIFLVIVPFLPVLAGAPVVTVDADKAPQLDADCHNYPAIVKVASTGQEYWCDPSLGPNGKWRPVNEAPCCCGRDEHGSCSGCSPAQECYQGGHICVSQNSLWICADPDGDGVLRFHTIDSQGNMRWEDGYDLDHDYAVDKAESLRGSGSVPIDANGDGAADLLFVDDIGLAWANGTPITRRPAIISFSMDTHYDAGCYDCADGLDWDDVNNPHLADANVAWALLKASEYGIRFAFDVQMNYRCADYSAADCPGDCRKIDTDADGTYDKCMGGLQSEPLQYAVQHGLHPGVHTADHCSEGIPGPFWHDQLSWWYQNAKPVYACGGTVTVTEGSDEVVGSGTAFSHRCAGDTTHCVSSPGMLFAVDCDGDGDFETERIIRDVDFDAQKLWLDQPLPSDCDGDGNPNESLSGLQLDDNDPSTNPRVMIAHVWKHSVEAFVRAKEEVERRTGADDYEADWFAHPGQWGASDHDQALLSSMGIRAVTTHRVGYWGMKGGMVGPDAPASIEYARLTMSCRSSVEWYDFLFDRILEAQTWADFYSHPPYPEASCPSSGMFFSREGLERLFQRCQQCMAEGTCICTDPVTAASLDRMFDAFFPSGYNQIINPKMLAGDGWSSDLADASAHRIFGWGISGKYDLNGDGTPDTDIDSTVSVQYDETDDITWLQSKSKDVYYSTGVTLRSGWYIFHAGIVVEGLYYPAGDGYQLQIYLQPSTDRGMGFVIPIQYYVVPDTFPKNAYRGGDLKWNNTSHRSQSDLIGIPENGHGDRMYRNVFAKFYVPPQLDGIAFTITHRILGGDDPYNGVDDDGDGSVDETDRVGIWRQTLTRIIPQQTGGGLGGYWGHPNVLFSFAPHVRPQNTHVEVGYRTGAFMSVWPFLPMSDLDLDGTYDAPPDIPDYDWRVAIRPTSSNTDYVPWKIGGNGTFYVRGLVGWNSRSVEEKFVHGSEDGARLDVDPVAKRWFGDTDGDGTKDDNEHYLDEAGGGGESTPWFNEKDYWQLTEKALGPYPNGCPTFYSPGNVAEVARPNFVQRPPELSNNQSPTACRGILRTDDAAGGDIFFNLSNNEASNYSYGFVLDSPATQGFRALVDDVYGNWERARVMIGGVRTESANDLTTAVAGAFFWCNPNGDMDLDGKTGDEDGDGTYCEETVDDPDECNWYAVKRWVDSGNQVSYVKTGVSCVDPARHWYVITVNDDDSITMTIDDADTFQTTFVDNLPTSEALPVFGVWLESAYTGYNIGVQLYEMDAWGER